MKRQKYPRINLCLSALLIAFLGLGFPGTTLAEPLVSEETLGRVEQLQAQQHWLEALRVLRAEAQQNPSNQRVQQALLEMFWWTSNAYEGQQLLARLQAEHPSNLNTTLWETQYTVGPIVAQGDGEQEAQRLPYLQNLLTQSRDTPQTDLATRLYLEGMIHKLEAQPEQAEELFLRALYANPNFLPALQALTDGYIDRHQATLSANQLAHALDLAPNNADNFYLAGRIFLEKGDPAQALAHFQKSRTLDPMERPKRLYWTAEAERQLGKLDDAARDYRMVLSFWPNRADIWIRYADAMSGQQYSKPALIAYQKAYGLQPSIIDPMIADAQRQFWTKPVADVLPLYQRLSQIAPDQDRWLLLRSDLHYAIWQEGLSPNGGAIEALREQIRQSASYPNPPLKLAELQLAAIRVNGWTPPLVQLLERINQEAISPYTKALCQLLLNHPVGAKTISEALPLTENLDFELQRWALHHFWPLPPEWSAAANETNPYWPTWENRDRQTAEALIATARTRIHVGDAVAAEEMLNRARPWYPLHPELYFLLAQSRQRLQDPVAAQTHLQTALLLGFKGLEPKKLLRFEKQILQAKKRLEARQKP